MMMMTVHITLTTAAQNNDFNIFLFSHFIITQRKDSLKVYLMSILVVSTIHIFLLLYSSYHIAST